MVLEECNARAIRFNCPNMTQLSFRLSNIVSFSLQDCSNLRHLDLQRESASLSLHPVAPEVEGVVCGATGHQGVY